MNNDTSLALLVLVLAGIGVAVLAFMCATPAVAGDVCLTKKEARHLWPKRHIYWYSADHCWSNRRGPPRGIKVDPLPAEKNSAAKNPAVNDARAELPKPKYGAPLHSNEPLRIIEDGCCWPKLDELVKEPNASGPIIMFPELTDKLDALNRWIADRWKQ